MRLSYFDVAKGKTVRATGTATVTVKGESTSWLEDHGVRKNWTIAEMAKAMREMAAAGEKGDFRGALRCVEKAIRRAERRYPALRREAAEADADIRRTVEILEDYRRKIRERI